MTLQHADPAFTLRVYAHAMRDEESDLSFAEFGGPKRLYPALRISGDESESSNYADSMARREGFASQRSWRCLVGRWPTETPDAYGLEFIVYGPQSAPHLSST